MRAAISEALMSDLMITSESSIGFLVNTSLLGASASYTVSRKWLQVSLHSTAAKVIVHVTERDAAADFNSPTSLSALPFCGGVYGGPYTTLRSSFLESSSREFFACVTVDPEHRGGPFSKRYHLTHHRDQSLSDLICLFCEQQSPSSPSFMLKLTTMKYRCPDKAVR